MTLPTIGAPWIEAIDVSEHQCIDFDTVAEQDIGVVIIRARRGTRQDARWVEHVRAVRRNGLHGGSYWHVDPSAHRPPPSGGALDAGGPGCAIHTHELLRRRDGMATSSRAPRRGDSSLAGSTSVGVSSTAGSTADRGMER